MSKPETENKQNDREVLLARLREQKRQRIDTAVSGVVSDLRPAQREFLIYYLLDSNATRAADLAGYAHPNTAGPRLLKTPKIQEAIGAYFHAQEMPAHKAVALLSEKASLDLSPYLHFIKDADGRITDAWLDLEAMRDDGLGHAIKGIRYTRDGRMMAETEDSLKALEDIMRYHGLFGAKGTDDDPINVLQKITTIVEERDAGNGDDSADEAED